jgi:hypothetical protein
VLQVAVSWPTPSASAGDGGEGRSPANPEGKGGEDVWKKNIWKQAKRILGFVNDEWGSATQPLRAPAKKHRVVETRMVQQQTLLEVLLKKLPQALEAALGEGAGEECLRLLQRYEKERAPCGNGKVSLGAFSVFSADDPFINSHLSPGRTHTERRGHEVAGRACTLERFKGRGAGECVGGCEVSGLTPSQQTHGSSSPAPIALLSARFSMLTPCHASPAGTRGRAGGNAGLGAEARPVSGSRWAVGGSGSVLGQPAHASSEARRT